MQGAISFTLVVVFLLSTSLTDAKELQANTSTSKCKQLDPNSGMPGMPGVPGIPGTPGAPGRDGFKGEKGSIGKRGLQGVMGVPGKIGPQGPEGSKGEIGEKGSSGIPGNSGPKGVKGSKGERGLMGAKGGAGISGSIGPKGQKGSKGETGIGTKGEKGDPANMDPRQRANWKQCAWKRLDRTDNGKLTECSFNKLHDNTALRVSYQGNVNVYSDATCNRWYFKFNGNECSGPLPIESVVYNDWPGGRSDIHRNHFFEGYCENLARGRVSVELWIGKCSGYRLGDAHTGWNSVSRIMIEEVPPSQ